MESPYAQEVSASIEAVQRAARISRMVLTEHDKGTIEKADLSPVTVADFAIQALLVSLLHSAFPNDRFVGEESAADLRNDGSLLQRVWDLLQRAPLDETDSACKLPDSPEKMCEMIDWCGNGEPGAPGRVWVFDPIDGTKTFVQGRMYAINVALLEDGKQVVGVVGCPTLPLAVQGPISNDTTDPEGRGSVLVAVKGHGAHVASLQPNAPLRRLPAHAHETRLEDLTSVTCLTMSESGVDEVHRLVAEKVGAIFPGCDLLGWVPRWVSLGLGLSNMTVWVYRRRDRFAKVWDHAGAMLLFEEVGGKITDIDGRDIDLRVGRTMTANHGFVAAPKNVHHLVLDTVQSTLREQGKQHLLA